MFGTDWGKIDSFSDLISVLFEPVVPIGKRTSSSVALVGEVGLPGRADSFVLITSSTDVFGALLVTNGEKPASMDKGAFKLDLSCGLGVEKNFSLFLSSYNFELLIHNFFVHSYY